MNSDGQIVKKIQSHGRLMDYAPRTAKGKRPSSAPAISDVEKRRREIAKREIQRREEIQRQIEAQREADIVAKRRAEEARRELARREAEEAEENARILAERKRVEEEKRMHEEEERKKRILEIRAMNERHLDEQERRAELARKELARRKAEEQELRPATENIISNITPKGSLDPLAVKHLQEERVAKKNAEIALRNKAVQAAYVERANKQASIAKMHNIETPHRRSIEVNPDNVSSRRLGNVNEFETELLDLEKSDFDEGDEHKIAHVHHEMDSEKSVRSPFINTQVEKRPLAAPGSRRTIDREDEKPMPTSGRRYVPYDETPSHKQIYDRKVKAEKKNINKDVPTVVVTNASKRSNIALIIAIVLTVALGALVGTITYLAFFQS